MLRIERRLPSVRALFCAPHGGTVPFARHAKPSEESEECPCVTYQVPSNVGSATGNGQVLSAAPVLPAM